MTAAVRYARVVDTALSVDRVVAAVSDARVGGIALFIGVVRDTDEGHGVQSLDYTQHPSAEQVLLACAERVAAAHDVISVAVEHRVGHLVVGDLAVVVATTSAHRGSSFDASRALIDTLKAEVPIWKHQLFSDGTEEWVGAP